MLSYHNPLPKKHLLFSPCNWIQIHLHYWLLANSMAHLQMLRGGGPVTKSRPTKLVLCGGPTIPPLAELHHITSPAVIQQCYAATGGSGFGEWPGNVPNVTIHPLPKSCQFSPCRVIQAKLLHTSQGDSVQWLLI